MLYEVITYRARATEKDYKDSGAKALAQTVTDFGDKAPKAVQETFERPSILEEIETPLLKTEKAIHKDFNVNFNKTDWCIS